MNPDRLADPAKKNYFRTIRQEFSGVNESGLEPIETKILVLTDSIGNTTNSGLVQIPPDVAERMTFAVTSGVIVAIGGAAFTDWPHSDRPWPGKNPKVGDRVRIARYAGMVEEGSDGKMYRLCQDKEVAGFEVGHKPQVFAAGAMTGTAN